MGYYTLFDLEIVPDQPIDFPDQFQQVTEYSLSTLESDSIKWYDCDSDMLTLSRMYPNHIFTLHGDGEEQDDKWQAVYVNGQVTKVYAELIYPPIDIKSIDNIGERCPELFL